MNPQFRLIVIGGTGQVGSAVAQSLLAESECREVVMVARKPVTIADSARLRSVVMDAGAADFEMRVADLAREVFAGGDRMCAVSSVGVGSGSSQWTEEQLKQLEIGVVGGFARGVRQAGVAQFCFPWGNIEQRDIGKAVVAEIAKKADETGVVFYDNQGMRKSIRRQT